MKKENNGQIHYLFDGHAEKPFSEMSAKEKLDCLYLQRLFYIKARNAKIIPREKDEE